MCCCNAALAQPVAIKTNALYWATTTPNLGVEMAVGKKHSFQLFAGANPWKRIDSEDARLRHWVLMPEYRYWLCDRFAGHFVGLHAHGGQFNMGGIDGGIKLLGTDFGKLKDARFQGWFVGAGLTYGYDWVLSRRWNIEAEIGLGYSYVRYDRFRCVGCGRKMEEDATHHYVGITKAAINLVYLF